ncbi:hypothetical protein ACMD2_12793 [Ananas comosus]|uniref:Uncharacterized protein n=1 Tax=Ananas comosus TaxID=4615 RepID=A0A199UUJ5_ANACO|nr:hypothetical protein ACMD2_12793 [Ananas comosus]
MIGYEKFSKAWEAEFAWFIKSHKMLAVIATTKVVEATRIPNTTKEPLEATPQEANAQILTKAMNLLSALHVFHHATTHVWITVFSCFVKGFVTNPILSTNPVQLFTRKNPRSPAATLREGMIPTVRLSLCVMTQKSVPSIALTTNPLIVICSLHGGISSSSAAAAAAPGEGSSGSPISAAAEVTSVPIWRSLRVRVRVRVASGERREEEEEGEDWGR